MSIPLVIAVAIILGSIAFLQTAVHREGPRLQQRVCAGMVTLNLGFALLVGSVIPAGTVSTLAQLVFTATAIWFIALEWRARRQERHHGPTIRR